MTEITGNQGSERAFRISNPEQIKAIGAPERLRIIEFLLDHGPATAAEMGAAMNRPPQALYYHIKLLEKAGILLIDREEPSKRRPQKRYRLVSPRLRLDVDQDSNDLKAAMSSAMATLLRAAERNYRDALANRKPVLVGKRRDFTIRRLRVRLDAAKLRKLNELIDQIESLMESTSENDSNREFVITMAVSPID